MIVNEKSEKPEFSDNDTSKKHVTRAEAVMQAQNKWVDHKDAHQASVLWIIPLETKRSEN